MTGTNEEEELAGTNEEKEEEETGTNEELAFLNSRKKHEIMRSCLSNLVLQYVIFFFFFLSHNLLFTFNKEQERHTGSGRRRH